jgi:hypothetical protein
MGQHHEEGHRVMKRFTPLAERIQQKPVVTLSMNDKAEDSFFDPLC